MSVIDLLVNVMGPVVVIVGIGWVAGRRMAFDVQTLSRLAFWVLGAAFVLDVFADAELDGSVVAKLVLGALGAMLVGGLVAYFGARWAGFDTGRAAAATMTSAYGNVGNAGLAISAFAFGDAAIPIAAVLMIAINLTGITAGVALASARTHGLVTAARRAAGAPMSIAAAAALLMNNADASFPLVLERSISIMGNALIPVMLLTLGMQLAGTSRLRFNLDLGLVGGTKLLVVPVVAAGLGLALGLEGDALGVLVIQSSMPPAVFCAVVALEYDLESDRVTALVLGTTLLSLITIPVALVAVT